MISYLQQTLFNKKSQPSAPVKRTQSVCVCVCVSVVIVVASSTFDVVDSVHRLSRIPFNRSTDAIQQHSEFNVLLLLRRRRRLPSSPLQSSPFFDFVAILRHHHHVDLPTLELDEDWRRCEADAKSENKEMPAVQRSVQVTELNRIELSGKVAISHRSATRNSVFSKRRNIHAHGSFFVRVLSFGLRNLVCLLTHFAFSAFGQTPETNCQKSYLSCHRTIQPTRSPSSYKLIMHSLPSCSHIQQIFPQPVFQILGSYTMDLEYACPIWHTSITDEQSNSLEYL